MARRVGLEQIGAEAVIIGTAEFFKVSREIERHLDDINKSTKRLEVDSNKSWTSMAAVTGVAAAGIVAAAALITGAVGGLIGIATGVATEFESKMAIVEAIAKGTAEEMDALTTAIRGIATTSVISMSLAAEAAGELARGGIEIQDQIGGAVKAVTDLTIASAGELEIGRSATLVAAALKAFGLEGKDAATVVNAITAAAQRSSVTFVDLQRSFQQVAPVAAAFGFTVEETSAALGVLGEAGIRGSDAGTSLKQAFIQLAKPTKKGAELMNEFGINLLDTEGAARPLRDVIIDLETAFSDEAVAAGKVTEEQRRFALATIFGSDAIRAALILTDRGVASFDAMTAAMKDSTFSAEALARIMQAPLSAQFIILQNNISSLAQRIGSGLLPFLRNLTVEAIKFAQSLDPLAKVLGAFLATIGNVGGLGSAFAELDKIASPEIVAFVEGLVTSFLAIGETLTVSIIPAVQGLITAIGNFLAVQANVDAMAQGFASISTAILTVGTVISEVIGFVTDLVNEASRSEEALTRIKIALFAIAIVPIAGLAAAFATIAVAISQVLIPLALLTAAIVGVATVVGGLTGIFLTTINDIEAEISGADLDLAPDIENVQTDLDAAESAYSGSINAIEQIIDESEIEIAPDASITDEATKQIVENFGEAIIAIVGITGEGVDGVNEELDNLDADAPVRKFQELAETIDKVMAFVEAVVNQRIAAIERFFKLVAITATVSWAIVTVAIGIFLTSLSIVEQIVGNVFNNVIEAFGITREAAADEFNAIVTIVSAAVGGIGEFIGKVIGFFGDLISAMRTTLASWASQWERMGGIVGAAASVIGSHINNIIGSLQALSEISLPTIDLSGIGEGAEGVANQINAATTGAGASLAGLQGRIRALSTDFSNATPPISRAGAVLGGAGTTAGEVGGPGGPLDKAGKGAKKVGKEAEEAIPAIEGFTNALAKAVRLQSFIDEFGEAGAEAMNALVEGVVSNIDKDGAKAGEALHKFTQIIRFENVPLWRELGKELEDAFATALIERSDEAIDAAKEVVRRAAEAAKQQGALTLDSFKQAFDLSVIADQLGSDGAKLIDNLKNAIIKGGADLIRAAASATSGLINGFVSKVPIETARDYGRQIVAAVTVAIREKTPEALQALQDLVRSINFQAEIAKLIAARDKALAEAGRTLTGAIESILKDTQRAIAELNAEREIKKQVDLEINSLKELNDARIGALKDTQDWLRQVRALGREERDIRVAQGREDVAAETDRLEALAEARKKAAERAREALKGVGTPVGGLTIQRVSGAEDELKKELAAIEARFAREKVKREEKRKEEEADRAQRLRDQAQEANQTIVDAIAITNLRNTLNANTLRLQNVEEERQHQRRVSEIVQRGHEQFLQANNTAAQAINNANLVFNTEKTQLETLTTLANELFDEAFDDIKSINSELDTMFSRSRVLEIKITQGGGGEEEESFARGGVVSGPIGKAKSIIAHGGELVLSLAQVKALETRPIYSNPTPVQQDNRVSYNVNANYAQLQDPGSVLLDLQALAAMAAR